MSCVDLPSLYDRGSLELAVIDELIIADLILLKRDDLPCIAHEHRHLRGLGSWCCTDIEESISLLWRENEYRKHRRERLEIDVSLIECVGSLYRVVILMIEEVDSLKSYEFFYRDSFFIELIKDHVFISLESIESERSFSFVGKNIHDRVIVCCEYRLETGCEEFWEQEKIVIL